MAIACRVMLLPLQALLGEAELGAVLRVELTVPAAELDDEAILGHQERLGQVLFVVPHHDVPLELKENLSLTFD